MRTEHDPKLMEAVSLIDHHGISWAHTVTFPGAPGRMRASEIDVQLLDVLACFPDATLARNIAGHPTTAPETLERLLDLHSDVGVLMRIASHPQCPAPMLAELAGHPVAEVRAAVAGSPARLRPGDAVALASDPSPLVRAELAGRADLRAELVARLARDPYLMVIEAVVSRGSLPERDVVAILESCMECRPFFDRAEVPWFSGLVTAAAPVATGRMLELLVEISRSSTHRRALTSEALLALAGNAGLTGDDLTVLAASGYATVRAAVGSNTRTPWPVLQLLAGDRSARVVQAVAGNPGTPAGVLEQLAVSGGHDVVSAVLANPSCPEVARVAHALRAG